MEDKTNGKLTDIEMQIAIDEMKRNLPYIIQQTKLSSRILKSKCDSLVSEGFSEKQALEVIKARPLYE